MTEEDKKFLRDLLGGIQKRIDSIEKEMKAQKKLTKSTESKVVNLQKAVQELEGKF